MGLCGCCGRKRICVLLGELRLALDYLAISYGHGDYVQGLRLYSSVPRIGSRAVVFRPGDVAVTARDELGLGLWCGSGGGGAAAAGGDATVWGVIPVLLSAS